jgi:plasmid stability protein
MSVQITIRNVADEVRDELAARAARAGKSMKEYLREELERLARRPSLGQWLSGVRRRKELAQRSVSGYVILGHRDADRS